MQNGDNLRSPLMQNSWQKWQERNNDNENEWEYMPLITLDSTLLQFN